MTIWAHSELLSLLADWKAAYQAASSGKAYTIGNRSLTRQDIPEIRRQLDYLQGELSALSGNSRSMRIPARIVR